MAEIDLIGQTAALREALGRTSTISAARQVLSWYAIDAVRAVEADFTLIPGPAETLRDRVAQYHMTVTRDESDQRRDTKRVCDALVAHWATMTLAEFLTGFTDFNAEWGGQYRIRYDGVLLGQPVFEVASYDGKHPRRFRIGLTVMEVKR